jgi:hypothetical protein
MKSHILRGALAIAAASSILSGCGTYTPDFQEFWGTSDDNDKKIELIVRQVECELRRAVRLIESRDKKTHDNLKTPRQLDWLEKWGVDTAYLFTIEEKSIINPGVSSNIPLASAVTAFPGEAGTNTYPPPKTFTPITVTTPQNFSLGIGGQFSSDAYRQDKIHIPYAISDLVGPEDELLSPVEIEKSQCVTGENANASLFLQSDLKIYEWLDGVANLHRREQADFTKKDAFATQGAISHEVKFEIVSGANITPTWKLVRVSANQTAPFFNATRDRTQDLIITIGPTDNGQLKITGQQSAFAAELASSIANAVKGTSINP